MSYAAFFHEYPSLVASAVFVFGCLIGSFLNVCIYRIPAGKSVVHPGSHCGCGQPVAWYDNIPLLSWVLLRGKARCCGRPFSVRYPFVEGLTGAVFLGLWLLLPPSVAACGWLFASALIAATFIDFDHFEIPDVFSVGLALVGVVLSFAVPALHHQADEVFLLASVRSGLASIQGLLIGSALVLWVALLAELVLKKEAIGFGDVKFVGAIGAFCGWQGTLTALFGGAIVGTVWFVAALAWEKLRGRPVVLAHPDSTEKTADLSLGAHVPFGPMLAIAGLAHFMWLHKIINPYFALLSDIL